MNKILWILVAIAILAISYRTFFASPSPPAKVACKTPSLALIEKTLISMEPLKLKNAKLPKDAPSKLSIVDLTRLGGTISYLVDNRGTAGLFAAAEGRLGGAFEGMAPERVEFSVSFPIHVKQIAETLGPEWSSAQDPNDSSIIWRKYDWVEFGVSDDRLVCVAVNCLKIPNGKAPSQPNAELQSKGH